MTKRTLTNHTSWNAKSIEAFESKTDSRFILDLGNLGFSAKEISFKTMSDGTVIVSGKVTDGNPTYDADGNLDKFGHNKVREAFEVRFMLNTAKYDLSTVKVATKNGVTRVQAMKWGKTMSAPNHYVSGSYKNPTYKAYGGGLGFQARRTYTARPCGGYACRPCDYFTAPCSSYYVVSVPYTVQTGRSQAYAQN